MRIAVLGPLSVDEGTFDLSPRDRAVLAALVIHPGRIVRTEQLAEAVWGERPPASWNKIVQGCVGRLRRTLGQDALRTHPGGYRLAVSAEAVDAWRLEAAASTARELLARGQSDRAEQQAEAALRLWRGPPLPELEDWEPGRAEAARLLELRRDLEDVWLEASVREGHAAQVLSHGEALVGEAPLRERRWALLAWAQHQDGRRAEALLTLQRARSMLVRELGVDPGPELARLEQAILRQDPTLIAATVLPDPVCPYPGLAPYDVQDADAFFGRERQVAECLERLDGRGVVCVVGPSGCGKSSLVRAGIAAALTRAGHRVTVLTPGPDPVATLRTVTLSSPRDVLVVDQCEDVVAPGADPGDARRFLTGICEHLGQGRLVVALRADRLGELSGHTGFARLVESGLYLLGGMGAEDLRAAIERPARQAGCRLEPGLVDVLLRDVEDEPGALPLLSHALRQVWQRREGRTLTLAGYRDSGGIRNAVAQTAESLYESVPEQQRLLRDLMLRLVTVGDDDEPVGTRVPQRLLATHPAQRDLLERLVAARLVTLDADTVRIAHEALVAAWPRLRGWVEDDREGQRLLRHLALAADGWDGLGRPESELYRGGRLQRALDWQQRARPELTPTEQAFLDASVQLADRERERAAEALRRERTANRRLRVLLVVAAAGLVAAAVTGAAARWQGERARDAARAASEAARSATARQLGAQALLADRADQSLLYAAHAARLSSSVVSYANLVATLMRRPQLVAHAATGDPPLGALAVRPDGSQVAIVDVANRVWFYDPQAGAFQGSWSDGAGGAAGEARVVCRCAPVDYSPDGRTLAVGMLNLADPVVRFLDTATFTAKARTSLGGIPGSPVPWRGPVSQPRDVEYADQGGRLAVSMDHYANALSFSYLGSSVMVWDLARPDEPAARVDLGGRNVQVDLDAAGGLVYTADRHHPELPGEVYDLVDGTLRRRLPPGFGYPLALSPDGAEVAAGRGRDVLLTSTSGGPVRSLSGHRGQVSTLRFSPDGERLASAADDHTVIVWDVRTGDSVEVLDLGMHAAAGYPVGLGFSPDGATLFTVGQEGLLTWDLRGERRFMSRIATIADPVGWHWARGPLGYVPSPTGDLVAVNRRHAAGGSLQLLDVERNRVRSLPGTRGRPFRVVAWSPDGRQLAAITAAGEVSVWDAPSGRLRAGLALGPPLDRPMEVTSFGYAGRTGPLVVGSQHGTVYLVDLPAGRRGPPGPGVPQRPVASLPAAAVPLLAASPDGTTLTAFTGGSSPRSRFDITSTGNWTVLDARTGQVLRSGAVGTHVSAAAYSPDGDTVAFAAEGLMLLDVRTGRVRTVPGASGSLPGAEALTLDYSPTGSHVVAAHANGALTLWDVDPVGGQGAARVDVDARFAGFAGRHQVRFGTSRGEVFSWDVRPERAIRFACGVVRRDLTAAELRAVGVDREVATCPKLASETG